MVAPFLPPKVGRNTDFKAIKKKHEKDINFDKQNLMRFKSNSQQGAERDTGGSGQAYRDCGTFCRADSSASSSCAPMEWWVSPILRLEPQVDAMAARDRPVLDRQVGKGVTV